MEGVLSAPADAATLRVTSLFLSIDGEVNALGQGTPSFFIRLAGCNLRCWRAFGGCDTVSSFGPGTPMTVGALLARVDASGCPKVTLTGGEPLLQRGPALAALLRGLHDRGVFVSMETNGSIAPDFDGREHVGSLVYDYKCPSTGCTAAMRPFATLFGALGEADFLKFVLRDGADYAFARDRVLETRRLREARGNRCPTLAFSPLMPARTPCMTPDNMTPPGNGADDALDAASLVARVLEDRLFEVRINVQLHKYIWPDATTEV